MAQVSNPYSYNINDNYKSWATINSSLPTTETYLLNRSDDSNVVNITIPSGVKVIKATCNGTHDMCITEMYHYETKFITWVSSYGITTSTSYVGVTPGKIYKLNIIAQDDNGGGLSSGHFTISYSQSINNQTPTITDY